MNPLPLKSRRGCVSCRRRRVKCDEVKPVCRPCAKSCLACLWLLVPGTGPVWPVQKASKAVDLSLRIKSKFGNASPKPITFDLPPLKAVSNGYPPFESEHEYRLLLLYASTMKSASIQTSYYDHMPETSFEMTVALQEPWVRTALFAFGAALAACLGKGYSSEAFEHYGKAIGIIRRRLMVTQSCSDKQQMMVAILPLGMLDGFVAASTCHPTLHFVIIGEILRCIGLNMNKNNNSTLLSIEVFHRSAYEVYVYHMAVGAVYHPEAYQSLQLYVPEPYLPGCVPSSFYINTLAGLDINVFIIMFEMFKAAAIRDKSRRNHEQLRALQQKLTSMQHLYDLGSVVEVQDGRCARFKALTCVGLAILQIYCAKALDWSLSAHDPKVQVPMCLALHYLPQCSKTNVWTGYYSWMLSSLLCAATSKEAVTLICGEIEEITPQLHGASLEHLRKLLHVLNRLQAPAARNRLNCAGAEVSTIDDPLALMFQLP